MAVLTMTDPIYFAGVNLLTVSGLTITGYDPFRTPEIRVDTSPVSTEDFSSTGSMFLSGRPFNIRGIIARPSRELLDESIHDLNKILYQTRQTMQMPVRGAQMQLKNVTLTNIAYQNVAGGYIEFDAEFLADDPAIYAVSETALLAVSNLTSGDKSYPITIEGTTKQYPRFVLTLDSFTGTGQKSITINNPATDQSIIVARTWTAADILTIDCLPGQQYVKVNGVDVDFSGNFPYWNSGLGYINYTDTFTARQIDITMHYYKRYM